MKTNKNRCRKHTKYENIKIKKMKEKYVFADNQKTKDFWGKKLSEIEFF